MLNIVIFGAPGSGKGTQSERIVEKYGINHISTGDVLRAEIKNGTELGKTAKGYIDQGQLIPDELMIDILASVFDSFKDSKGVIFDGFPRTIAQAEKLDEILAEEGKKVDLVVDLDSPKQEILDRIVTRRICPDCKAVFNTKLNNEYPPPKDIILLFSIKNTLSVL